MSGDWDQLQTKFEELDVFIAFRQVCSEGKEWKDTEFYQRFLSEVDQGHFLWRCKTRADVDRRCERLSALFDTIKRDGYKSQRELALSRGEPAEFADDEIVVNIGRNGDLLFNDGAHRLAIAKLLHVPKVPIKIGVRHANWRGCILELLDIDTDAQPPRCSDGICGEGPLLRRTGEPAVCSTGGAEARSKRATKIVTRLPVADQLKARAAEYDVLADSYHSARFGHPPGQYDLQETQALVQDIVSGLLAGRSGTWRVLDVACGTGKVSLTVAQFAGVVVGADAVMGMLHRCAARFAHEKPRGTLLLTNASAENLPYRKGCFDIVVAWRFLHLFSTEAQLGFIREMVRVVKPGGHLVLEVKNRWYGISLYHFKDLWRTLKDGTTPSSYSSIGQLRLLEQQVPGIKLQFVRGLLLPKGWWFKDDSRASGLVRALARGPLKRVSGHLVAIYQKERCVQD